MHTTVCNNSYGPCNIEAVHKGDRCMWNVIVVYVVLAYSVPSIEVLWDMAMTSKA